MQTLADMRGVGVKNRKKYAAVLCGRPLGQTEDPRISIWNFYIAYRNSRILRSNPLNH